MRRTTHLPSILWLVTLWLGSLCIGSAFAAAPAALRAAPPTDEELAAAIEQYEDATREISLFTSMPEEELQAVYDAAAAAFGHIDFSGLTLDQFKRVWKFGALLPAERGQEARDRLLELSRDEGAEGAVALLVRLAFFPGRRPGMSPEDLDAARQAAVKQVAGTAQALLRHPGLHEAMRGDEAGRILNLLGWLEADDIAAVRDELIGLEAAMNEEMPPRALARILNYFQTVSAKEIGLSPADRERIRRKLIALTDSALAEWADDPDHEADRLAVQKARDFLAAADARGELIGHTAPEMEFIWASTESPLKSLADLRGNVVVVDFWTTWCGPCIRSFPQVRELVARYEGYPVVVLGITSIQGFHIEYTGGGSKRIDTEDDREKEFALMAEFMAQQNMTWPVVFSAGGVYNPDYGVRGIPHVAIIDAAGKVRYNGLHPALPEGRSLYEKSQKIDGLLKEAGLRAPAPMPEPDSVAGADVVGDR